MAVAKAERMALERFIAHWRQYAELQPYHEEWVYRHATFRQYARGDCIYDSAWEEKHVFYVVDGLLARLHTVPDPHAEKEKRKILSIGRPMMALTSTDHLYSDTQGLGEIVAIRPSTVLTFSYQAVSRLAEVDGAVKSFMGVLANKKIRQLARLRQLAMIPDPQSRYLRFTEILPELRELLSQREQQDLLGISKSTIVRASYFLLTGKNMRK